MSIHNKEDEITGRRFMDLADICYRRNIPLHSHFLNIHEQTILRAVSDSFHDILFYFDGGYKMAERRIVCFMPLDFNPGGVSNNTGEVIYADEVPFNYLACIKIDPLNKKFCEELTHRDYLGAVLGLGLKREMIGDIITDDKTAYIFADKDIVNFLIDSLDKVKHTAVKAVEVAGSDVNRYQKIEKSAVNVASTRIDAVLSAVYKISRSKADALIDSGKVALDSVIEYSHDTLLKENVIMSVRGFGRFRLVAGVHETKKKRIILNIEKWI